MRRASLSIVVLLCLAGCTWNRQSIPKPTPPVIASVGAFGTIVPINQLRNLNVSGNTTESAQIIDSIYVKEGDFVEKGQVLAVLRGKPYLVKEQKNLLESLTQYRKQLSQSDQLLKRYQSLTKVGGYAWSDYQQRVIFHESILNRLFDAKLRLERIRGQIANCNLLAPFDGTVTRIYSRNGEPPSSQGILQMGDISQLQAELEVYESEFSKIKLGQTVRIKSDSGAFSGFVDAKVTEIVPGIRMRTTLPTTATPMVDVRVGIVRARIPTKDTDRLRDLVGAKILSKIYL